MRARVVVTLKPGVLDPQGKAIEGALASIGIKGVASVRQGKVFDIETAGGDRAGVEAMLRHACERLLANTVIENYAVEVDEASAGAAHTAPAAVPPAAPAEEPGPMAVEPAAAEPPPLPAAQPEDAGPAAVELAAAEPPPLPAAAEPEPPSAAEPELPPNPAAVDPARATEEAAAHAEMPTEGHP